MADRSRSDSPPSSRLLHSRHRNRSPIRRSRSPPRRYRSRSESSEELGLTFGERQRGLERLARLRAERERTQAPGPRRRSRTGTPLAPQPGPRPDEASNDTNHAVRGDLLVDVDLYDPEHIQRLQTLADFERDDRPEHPENYGEGEPKGDAGDDGGYDDGEAPVIAPARIPSHREYSNPPRDVIVRNTPQDGENWGNGPAGSQLRRSATPLSQRTGYGGGRAVSPLSQRTGYGGRTPLGQNASPAQRDGRSGSRHPSLPGQGPTRERNARKGSSASSTQAAVNRPTVAAEHAAASQPEAAAPEEEEGPGAPFPERRPARQPSVLHRPATLGFVGSFVRDVLDMPANIHNNWLYAHPDPTTSDTLTPVPSSSPLQTSPPVPAPAAAEAPEIDLAALARDAVAAGLAATVPPSAEPRRLKRTRSEQEAYDENEFNVVSLKPRKRARKSNCCAALFCCCPSIPRWLCGPFKEAKDLGRPNWLELRITNEAHTEDITDEVLQYARSKALSGDPFKPIIKQYWHKRIATLPTSKSLPPRPTEAIKLRIRREVAKHVHARRRFLENSLSDGEEPPAFEPSSIVVPVDGSAQPYEFQFIHGDHLHWDVHEGSSYKSVWISMLHTDKRAAEPSPWKIEIPHLDAGEGVVPYDRQIVFVVLKHYAPPPLPCWWFVPDVEEDLEPFIECDDLLVRGRRKLERLYEKQLHLGPLEGVGEETMVERLERFVNQNVIKPVFYSILHGDYEVTPQGLLRYAHLPRDASITEYLETPIPGHPGRARPPRGSRLRESSSLPSSDGLPSSPPAPLNFGETTDPERPTPPGSTPEKTRPSSSHISGTPITQGYTSLHASPPSAEGQNPPPKVGSGKPLPDKSNPLSSQHSSPPKSLPPSGKPEAPGRLKTPPSQVSKPLAHGSGGKSTPSTPSSFGGTELETGTPLLQGAHESSSPMDFSSGKKSSKDPTPPRPALQPLVEEEEDEEQFPRPPSDGVLRPLLKSATPSPPKMPLRKSPWKSPTPPAAPPRKSPRKSPTPPLRPLPPRKSPVGQGGKKDQTPPPVSVPAAPSEEQVRLDKTNKKMADRERYMNTVAAGWKVDRKYKHLMTMAERDKKESENLGDKYEFILDLLITDLHRLNEPYDLIRNARLAQAHQVNDARNFQTQDINWQFSKFQKYQQDDAEKKARDTEPFKDEYWRIIEDHISVQVKRLQQAFKDKKSRDEAKKSKEDAEKSKLQAYDTFLEHQYRIRSTTLSPAEVIQGWERFLGGEIDAVAGDDVFREELRRLSEQELGGLKPSAVATSTAVSGQYPGDEGENGAERSDEGSDPTDESSDLSEETSNGSKGNGGDSDDGDDPKPDGGAGGRPTTPRKSPRQSPTPGSGGSKPESSGSKPRSGGKGDSPNSTSSKKSSPAPADNGKAPQSDGKKTPEKGNKRTSKSSPKSGSKPDESSQPSAQGVSIEKAKSNSPRQKTPPAAGETQAGSQDGPQPEQQPAAASAPVEDEADMAFRQFLEAQEGAPKALTIEAFNIKLRYWSGRVKSVKAADKKRKWAKLTKLGRELLKKLEEELEAEDDEGGGDDDNGGDDGDDKDTPDDPDVGGAAGGATAPYAPHHDGPGVDPSYSRPKSQSPKNVGPPSGSPKGQRNASNASIPKVSPQSSSADSAAEGGYWHSTAVGDFHEVFLDVEEQNLDPLALYKFWQKKHDTFKVDWLKYSKPPPAKYYEVFKQSCLDQIQEVIERHLRPREDVIRGRVERRAEERAKVATRTRSSTVPETEQNLRDSEDFLYQLQENANQFRKFRRRDSYVDMILNDFHDYAPEQIMALRAEPRRAARRSKRKPEEGSGHSIAFKMTLIGTGRDASPIREDAVDYFDDELPIEDEMSGSDAWSETSDVVRGEAAALDGQLLTGNEETEPSHRRLSCATSKTPPSSDNKRKRSESDEGADGGLKEAGGRRKSPRISGGRKRGSTGVNDIAIPNFDPNDPDLLDKAMNWTQGRVSTPGWNRPLRYANRNPEIRFFLRTTYPEQLQRNVQNVRFAAVEDVRDDDTAPFVGDAEELDQYAGDYVDPFVERDFVAQPPQWSYIDSSAFGVREDDMVWRAPRRIPSPQTWEDVVENQGQLTAVVDDGEPSRGRNFSDWYDPDEFDAEVDEEYKSIQTNITRKTSQTTHEPQPEMPSNHPPSSAADAPDLFSDAGKKRTEARKFDRQRARAHENMRDMYRRRAMRRANEVYERHHSSFTDLNLDDAQITEEEENIAMMEDEERQPGWDMRHVPYGLDDFGPEELDVSPPTELEYEPMDIDDVDEDQLEARGDLGLSDESFDAEEKAERQGIVELLALPPSLQTPEKHVHNITEGQNSAGGGILMSFIRDHIRRVLAATLRTGRLSASEVAQSSTRTHETQEVIHRLPTDEFRDSRAEEAPEVFAQPSRIRSPSLQSEEVLESFVTEDHAPQDTERRSSPSPTNSRASTESPEVAKERPWGVPAEASQHAGAAQVLESGRMAGSRSSLPKSLEFIRSTILAMIFDTIGEGTSHPIPLQMPPVSSSREHALPSVLERPIDTPVLSPSFQSLSTTSDTSDSSAISDNLITLQLANPDVFAEVLRAIPALILRHTQTPPMQTSDSSFTNTSTSSSASSDDDDNGVRGLVIPQSPDEVAEDTPNSPTKASSPAPPAGPKTLATADLSASTIGRYRGRGKPKKHKRPSVSLRDHFDSDSGRTLRPRRCKAEVLQQQDSSPTPVKRRERMARGRRDR